MAPEIEQTLAVVSRRPLAQDVIELSSPRSPVRISLGLVSRSIVCATR